MLSSFLKAVAVELVRFPAGVVIGASLSTPDNNDWDHLGDGLGNVILDDEVVTQQEADALGWNGSLHDHKYR